LPVWLELGLEVADDEQLLAINRLHSVADFEDCAARAKAAGLMVIAHAILGLPGDGRAGARRTAQVLARSAVDGVKVHHLMVLRRTQLAQWWKQGRVELLTPQEYVSWLADFVERLSPDQVLHRITGDSPAEDLLAPHWDLHKNAVRELLAGELRARGTRQGALFCAERELDQSRK
jgi:radical SAM protein (TIGR01212 family)